MHLVVITTRLAAGGAEKQSVAIANGLAATHDVTLLTLSHSDFRSQSVSSKVRQICLDFPRVDSFMRSPSDLRKGTAALKNLHPDAVVSLNFPAQTLVWFAQIAGLRTRHVISERQEHLGSPIRIQARRSMYRRASLVTANTSATARSIADRGLRSFDQIVVVPNIVETPTRVSRAIDRKAFKWICIARLDEQKDVATLIRACRLLKCSGATFELNVVGDGIYADALGALITGEGLTNEVRMLGERRDAMELLMDSDSLVLSSKWEGTPNVVLEAAIRGIPVVATDVGGTRAALPPDARVFLVPPSAPPALAESMAHMMGLTVGERSALGHSMISYVQQKFPEDEILARWEELLTIDR